MEVKCLNCRFKFDIEAAQGPVMCVCPRCGNKFTFSAPVQNAPEQDMPVQSQAPAPQPQQPQPGPVVQAAPPAQPVEPQVVYVERPPEKNNTLLYVLVGVVAALLIGCGFLLFNRNSTEKQPEEPIAVTTPTQTTSVQTAEPARSAPAASSSSLDGYYTLSGQLANRDIEMRIRVDGNDVYGSYVYVGLSQVDIDLYGTVYGNRMELHETNEYGEHSGDFIGTFNGSSFDGTFHRYRNGRNDKNFNFYLH